MVSNGDSVWATGSHPKMWKIGFEARPLELEQEVWIAKIVNDLIIVANNFNIC